MGELPSDLPSGFLTSAFFSDEKFHLYNDVAYPILQFVTKRGYVLWVLAVKSSLPFYVARYIQEILEFKLPTKISRNVQMTSLLVDGVIFYSGRNCQVIYLLFFLAIARNSVENFH